MRAPAVSVVLPARNEEAAVGTVVGDVRRVLTELGLAHEIIVVDDGSTDATAETARHAGARVIRHAYGIGNGAAVKSGLRHARGERIVLMDADGQHDATDIPRLLEALARYDLVVGARTSASEGAFHRNIANRIYNRFATYIARRPILDLTSGFRAVRRSVALAFIDLLPNEFSYPSTITLCVCRSGHALHYIPIRAARRKGHSKIRIFRDGLRFFLILFKIGTLFAPFRVFLPIAAAFFLSGLAYEIWLLVFHHRFTTGALFLLTTGVLVFLLSLIAQQVAMLHFGLVRRLPRQGVEAPVAEEVRS